MKREGNKCECCGVKQSVAKGREVKLEVHHNAGIVAWDELIDLVFQHVLIDPAGLTVFCKECHEKEHTPDIKREITGDCQHGEI